VDASVDEMAAVNEAMIVDEADLDIIDLTTPSGEVIEISSSCDLSVFSLKVDPQRIEGGGGASEGSSSASIGEL
jgi:hypothetical protein